MKEKECYLELERVCRLLTETIIEDDEEFIKTARKSLRAVLGNLADIHKLKEEEKQRREAMRRADKLWGCLKR